MSLLKVQASIWNIRPIEPCARQTSPFVLHMSPEHSTHPKESSKYPIPNPFHK